MKTGFYNIQKLTTSQLRKFYKRAMMLSYEIRCESKYTEHNRWRGYSRKYSIEDFLKMVSIKNHNVCIDRSIQHPDIEDTKHGDIGFKLHSGYDEDWHQISFYLSLSNLEKLVTEFGLEMQ